MNAVVADSPALAELASLFALAYRRLLLTRQKGLEEESHHAALCPHTVNARDGVTGKDEA